MIPQESGYQELVRFVQILYIVSTWGLVLISSTWGYEFSPFFFIEHGLNGTIFSFFYIVAVIIIIVQYDKLQQTLGSSEKSSYDKLSLKELLSLRKEPFKIRYMLECCETSFYFMKIHRTFFVLFRKTGGFVSNTLTLKPPTQSFDPTDFTYHVTCQ